MSSIIYANNYRFSDSRYAILIIRKQDATGNLLLSIKQDDQGDWDNQDDWDNQGDQGDYGDWNGWNYTDDWMGWKTGMIWTTKDDQAS